MRARVLVAIATAATVVLLGPTAAHAKGADQATIEGDDLAAPIVVSGNEGDSGPLESLTELTGFFPSAFKQSPDPMLKAEPTGQLGPKYVITWHVPTGDGAAQDIVQDVYPFAEGGPLTYMAPGQAFIEGDVTRGGWYRSITALTTVLVHLGVPQHPMLGAPVTSVPPATTPAPATTAAPAPTPRSVPSGDSWWSSAAARGLVVLLAGTALLGGWALTARRRGGVAAT